jgi:hypothetical protein
MDATEVTTTTARHSIKIVEESLYVVCEQGGGPLGPVYPNGVRRCRVCRTRVVLQTEDSDNAQFGSQF